MTLPPTPSAVLAVRLYWDITSDNVLTTTKLYFAYSGGPPSTSDCATLASGVAAAVNTDLCPLLSNTSALEGVDVTDLASSTGAVGSWSGVHDGTRAGSMIDAGVCALLNFKVARRYRGGKPRSYFPFGITTDAGDAQNWGGSFVNAVNTAYGTFLIAMASVTGGSTDITNQVNVSYYKGYSAPTIVNNRAKNHLAPRATPVVDTITGHSMQTKFGTQRRRIGA